MDENINIFIEVSTQYESICLYCMKAQLMQCVAFKVLEHDSSRAAQIYSKIFRELAKEFPSG